MSDEVLISQEGAMGVITLNRPRALNALSLAMIDAIYQTLQDWQDDASVAAVLIEGNGERAFCAGGDIRAARDLLLAGETEDALSFYEREYRNNLMIATYAKPIIAIGHGYVMGGGIGLAGHAGIRIAVEDAQYAMPESAIGLFCDVGVNARLAKVAAHRALLFEFAGLPVGVADAMALDLVDLMVPKTAVADLRAALIDAAAGGRDKLKAVAESFAADAGEATFCAVADRLAPAFTARSAATVLDVLKQKAQPGDDKLMETIFKRCPTSLEAILQIYWVAYEDSDAETVLRHDLRLARYLSVRSDFAEGVRAVVVDKDNNPVWQPANPSEVDADSIARLLAEG